MSFKIGLKLWSNNILYLPDGLKLYKEGLFDYIELYIAPGSFNKLINSYKALPIPYILHCPHESHGFSLAEKSKEQYNLKVFEEVKKYADILKAKSIIVHSGSNGTIKETERQLRILNDSRIIIENTVHIGSTIEEIKLLLNKNNIGFCLDFNHAVCTANKLKIDPLIYLKEFNKLNPAVYHLTGGNFKSTVDVHNHFSESNYPWEKVIYLLKTGSRITIETDRDRPGSLSDFKEDTRFLKSIIDKTSITLRKADFGDLIFLYNLRNEETVRNASFSSAIIDLKTHKDWYKKKLKDNNQLILIGEINKEKIGQIRFEIEKDHAEVSLAISPEQRGKGYGIELLNLGCQYVFSKLNINKIFAHIKPENSASLKVFSKAGFVNKGFKIYKSQKCIEMIFLH